MYWYFLSLLEAILLIAGAWFPLAKIDEFWVFTTEFSLFSLFLKLITSEEVLLGSIVFIFGFFIPILKILNRFLHIRFLELMKIHKFGMVDIFLFSFLIYSSKISSYFNLELMFGFYLLFCGVLLGYLQIIFNRDLE
jgi:uncharacterized paraquat-inducible protein A